MPYDSAKIRQYAPHAIIAFVVVIIGFQFLLGEDEIDLVPDDPKVGTLWACHECGVVERLSPRQRIERQRTTSGWLVGGKAAGEKVAPEEGRTSTRELVLGCSACGKLAVHLAMRCPQCKTAFASERNGQPQPCSKCGWQRELVIDLPPQPPPKARKPKRPPIHRRGEPAPKP